MPKYKITMLKRFTVVEKHWDEFDTTDQSKWDELRKKASDCIGKADVESGFSAEAPDDIDKWYELYYLTMDEVSENKEEDWDKDARFGPDRVFKIEDSNSNVVMEEEDYY